MAVKVKWLGLDSRHNVTYQITSYLYLLINRNNIACITFSRQHCAVGIALGLLSDRHGFESRLRQHMFSVTTNLDALHLYFKWRTHTNRHGFESRLRRHMFSVVTNLNNFASISSGKRTPTVMGSSLCLGRFMVFVTKDLMLCSSVSSGDCCKLLEKNVFVLVTTPRNLVRLSLSLTEVLLKGN